MAVDEVVDDVWVESAGAAWSELVAVLVVVVDDDWVESAGAV